MLRAWRHNANGQYQIVLQTIAAHIWQHPAYMGLPWEVAPQLAAQFIVRTSWPGQLRLLYHAFPGVLEDVQLRFDYEVQTDAATKRIVLARLPSAATHACGGRRGETARGKRGFGMTRV